MSSPPVIPESAPTSAAPGGAGASAVLAAAGRFGRRALDTALNWPGGRWPVPTVTSLFAIALVTVAGVELLPTNALSDVTLTVQARSEVLEVTLQPERSYVWWLPRGKFSLLTAPPGPACEQRERFDIVCTYEEPTAVTIKHGATVRFELARQEGTSAPTFTLAITPLERAEAEQDSLFEVRNRDDRVLVSSQDLLTFESQPTSEWRIPLIVERVRIGESLSDSVAPREALDTSARQPILIEGDVRIFARALGFDERYLIKAERFDPADVVQIPARTEAKGLLLGLLAFDDGADDDESPGFDVTLHTDLAEVFVRRLGGGHWIGVSTWAIVSKLPFWLALWVVWVSLIVVANYYSDRLGELRGHKHDG